MVTMRRLMVVVLVLSGSLGATASAQGSWFVLINDTDRPLIVQEAIKVEEGYRLVHPKRLAPGEVIRELRGPGTEKHLVIRDALDPSQLLFEGLVPRGPGDVAVSIRLVAEGLALVQLLDDR